ncbi:MAG: EamA family transporter [Actinomycetota bacterium]
MTPARAEKSAPTWLVWTALWIVYIVWGSTYLAIRIVVETMPSLLTAGIRFFTAGLVVATILVVKRGWSGIKVTRQELGASALIGSLLMLGGNGLVTIAEETVPSGLAALLIATVPLWVVLWRFIARDRIPGGTLIGVLIGFAGVAVLVSPGSGAGGASLGGMLTVVLAASLWATGSFFAKRVNLPHDPFLSTATQMLTGGAIMAVVGLARGEASGIVFSDFSTASLFAFAYLIVFGSLIAFTAYVWLLQHAPISKVATYAYVNPVVAIFLGWLILDEAITTTIVVGATIVVASVAAIVSMESRAARKSEERADLDTAPVADAPPQLVS